MEFVPWSILLRTFITFVALLICTRVMGKQTIAQMTILDFLTAVAIGNIGGSIAYHTDINPLNILLALVLFIAFAYLASYASLKSKALRRIFKGKPTLIIQNGKILEQNMTKIRYCFDNLNHQLREKGFFDISQVELAILEPNGQLSVLPKSQHRPLTPTDLKVPTKYEGLAIELIMDGQVIEKNLRENNLSKEWLAATLAKHGITDFKAVDYACLGTNGNVFFDLYKDKTTNPVDKG